MTQYSNIAYAVIFNLLFSLLAPLIWVAIPPTAALLFVAPQWKDTPANLNSKATDGGGIPFNFYNQNHDLFGMILNPFQWLPTLIEVTIDFLHAISYLFIYWK